VVVLQIEDILGTIGASEHNRGLSEGIKATNMFDNYANH
jgi:hypothetical protein